MDGGKIDPCFAARGHLLIVFGEATQRFGSRECQTERGTFTVKALQAGRYQLGVQVRSNANRPGTLVEAEVAEAGTASAREGGKERAMRIMGVGLGLVALLVGEAHMIWHRRGRAR